VALSHVVLVGEVNHPALLDCLGAHPLGLLHTLDQSLDRDVTVRGLGRHVSVKVAGGDDGRVISVRRMGVSSIFVTFIAITVIIIHRAFRCGSITPS